MILKKVCENLSSKIKGDFGPHPGLLSVVPAGLSLGMKFSEMF